MCTKTLGEGHAPDSTRARLKSSPEVSSTLTPLFCACAAMQRSAAEVL